MVGFSEVLMVIFGTIVIRFVFNLSKLDELIEKTDCVFISLVDIASRSVFYVICDIKYIKERFFNLSMLANRSRVYKRVLSCIFVLFIAGVILIDTYIFFMIFKEYAYHGASNPEYLIILITTYNLVSLGFYYNKLREGKSNDSRI